MGDRCWFEVYVRKRDAKAFQELVFHREGFEADPPHHDYPNAVYFQDDEANYGYYTECQDAGQRGLVFQGRSGAGGDYGPARFCAIDGQFHHIETLWDGTPAVGYDEEKRRLNAASLDAIEDYLQAYHRVRSILQGESRGRR